MALPTQTKQQIIAALNEYISGKDAQPVSVLFTNDAHPAELDRLAKLKTWSEMTPPRIVIKSVRFVTSDVALVDGSSMQYGSLILVRRIPILLVMKKQVTDWRIDSLRILVPAPKLLPQ